MPSIRINSKHCFNVEFSPFFPKLLACSLSENYGLQGMGSLVVVENGNSNYLKIKKSASWTRGLIDVTWMKNNENLLVTSSNDGSIQLWALFGHHSSRPLRIFKEHALDVTAVDSNCDFIVSGSWDSTVKIWDVNNISSVVTLKICQGIVHSVKWSPMYQNLLMSVSDDSHLSLWDKNSPKYPVAKVEHQNSQALDCDWSCTNPHEIAIADNHGVIHLWDIRNLGSPYFRTNSISKPIGKVRWSPYHRCIVAASSYDLSTSIWDLSQDEILETIMHHSGFVFGLDFNKSVPGLLADCGLDSIIHVFTPWSLHVMNCQAIFLKNKL